MSVWIIQAFVPYCASVTVLLFYNEGWMRRGLLHSCSFEAKNYTFTSCQTLYESSVPMEFTL